MLNIKKIVLLLILMIISSTLYVGCSSQKQNNTALVSKNNITSFKMHNIKGEEKEIKSKSERNKIIDLINSVKITASDVVQPDGVGFGVMITYKSGKKFYANYLADTFEYSTDGVKYTCCNIDKNIVDKLRRFYDKN